MQFYKRNNDVVVVAHTSGYSAELLLHPLHTQEIQSPIFFQLDDLYNINNIIISEIIMLSEDEYIDDEYIEDEDQEEYIVDDNDPEKVLIVPKDDYVINDGEVKVEHEKVLATPITTISQLKKYDFDREKVVLESLRKGEFRK